MQKLSRLKAIAAPFERAHVDTDMIIPKQFLTTVSRQGLAKGLFYDLRHDDQGQPVKDFILDQPIYRSATILVVGENFGCGSSREHAVWALLDAGYRCLISVSFADIFYANCFKNGVLPIILPQVAVATLMAHARRAACLSVDLPTQQVAVEGSDERFHFTIAAAQKEALLLGLDDIAMTLKQEAAIRAFEERDRKQRPWLWG